MSGDERTQPPPGHRPAVQRRRGDPRDTPVAPAEPFPQRAQRQRGEDDTTEPPSGSPRRSPGVPQAPIESYSAGAPRDRVIQDGRFGELFVLFIINILLGIVTLGIYRFWGKTRIRKYIWSRLSFRGERFEYSGRGMELFLGFLFALLVFGPPFFAFFAWIYFDPPRAPDDQGAALTPEQAAHFVFVVLAGLGLYIVASYFVHVANYAAYRYRVSRTIWRGIRGSVSGNAFVYGFLGFGLGWLNGLSLGWTKPWADAVMTKYRIGRTTIGSEPVVSTIAAGPLYGPFAAAWVITMVATIIAIIGISGLMFDYRELLQQRGSQPPLRFIILFALLIYLIPIVWLVTINFYRAALIRQIATTARLDGLAFRFDVGGWSLLWFNVANFLLILVSFGLLLPLVILRYVRFVARYLRIDGQVDYASIKQTQDRGPRYGEGIAEFFGVGVV